MPRHHQKVGKVHQKCITISKVNVCVYLFPPSPEEGEPLNKPLFSSASTERHEARNLQLYKRTLEAFCFLSSSFPNGNPLYLRSPVHPSIQSMIKSFQRRAKRDPKNKISEAKKHEFNIHSMKRVTLAPLHGRQYFQAPGSFLPLTNASTPSRPSVVRNMSWWISSSLMMAGYSTPTPSPPSVVS